MAQADHVRKARRPQRAAVVLDCMHYPEKAALFETGRQGQP
jgi:hypothetical protein